MVPAARSLTFRRLWFDLAGVNTDEQLRWWEGVAENKTADVAGWDGYATVLVVDRRIYILAAGRFGWPKEVCWEEVEFVGPGYYRNWTMCEFRLVEGKWAVLAFHNETLASRVADTIERQLRHRSCESFPGFLRNVRIRFPTKRSWGEPVVDGDLWYPAKEIFREIPGIYASVERHTYESFERWAGAPYNREPGQPKGSLVLIGFILGYSGQLPDVWRVNGTRVMGWLTEDTAPTAVMVWRFPPVIWRTYLLRPVKVYTGRFYYNNSNPSPVTPVWLNDYVRVYEYVGTTVLHVPVSANLITWGPYVYAGSFTLDIYDECLHVGVVLRNERLADQVRRLIWLWAAEYVPAELLPPPPPGLNATALPPKRQLPLNESEMAVRETLAMLSTVAVEGVEASLITKAEELAHILASARNEVVAVVSSDLPAPVFKALKEAYERGVNFAAMYRPGIWNISQGTFFSSLEGKGEAMPCFCSFTAFVVDRKTYVVAAGTSFGPRIWTCRGGPRFSECFYYAPGPARWAALVIRNETLAARVAEALLMEFRCGLTWKKPWEGKYGCLSFPGFLRGHTRELPLKDDLGLPIYFNDLWGPYSRMAHLPGVYFVTEATTPQIFLGWAAAPPRNSSGQPPDSLIVVRTIPTQKEVDQLGGYPPELRQNTTLTRVYRLPGGIIVYRYRGTSVLNYSTLYANIAVWRDYVYVGSAGMGPTRICGDMGVYLKDAKLAEEVRRLIWSWAAEAVPPELLPPPPKETAPGNGTTSDSSAPSGHRATGMPNNSTAPPGNGTAASSPSGRAMPGNRPMEPPPSPSLPAVQLASASPRPSPPGRRKPGAGLRPPPLTPPDATTPSLPRAP